MADDEDPFASVVDDCRYSSSQEDFLSHSKFAREDVTFAGDDGGESPAVVDSGRSRTELAGKDVAGGSNQVEFDGVHGDCEEHRVLVFPKSSTIEVVFDGELRVSEVPETESRRFRVREGGETPQKGNSIEPPLKKSRVSSSNSGILNGGKASPLVQCSEKLGIDSEDKNKQVVVFRGGVRVEIVNPLRCFAPDGVECTEKLVFEDEPAAQDEMRREKENQAKEKLDFGDDTEVIEIQHEETIEPKNGGISNDVDSNEDGNEKGAENREGGSSEEIERGRKRDLPRSLLGQKKLEIGDNTEVIEIQDEETGEPMNGEMSNDVGNNEDGNEKGTKNRGGGSSGEIERQRKRDLPRSLLGQIWGLNTNGRSDGSRNGGNRERGERIVEGNGGERSKTDETMKHLLDVLKMLATQMLCDADYGEVDIFETAKSRGMTFPCSRFLLDTKKDE